MRRLIVLTICLVLGACAAGIDLAPPPNLYRAGTNYPDDLVPEVWRTAEPRIFFMTDRVPDAKSYGADRSDSMAFGAATVKFGRDLDWAELLDRTRADSDKQISTLWVPEIEEIVRFEETPLPFVRRNGYIVSDAEARAAYDAQTSEFQDVIANEIRQTGNRNLLVYVHGFNSEFEDSLTALANIWHFAGREAVPISFTWPAGNGAGPLGYFRDRDAGVFSVHHTKEFLRMLAAMPQVDTIDIIAHSRGTDVVSTALRELMIEARGAGVHPQKMLKTGTLIMAAPDLDVGIVRQRLRAERFSEAFDQMNLYINPNDGALRLSGFLTQSTRLGALTNDDFRPGELDQLREQALVHFIRVEDVRGGFGHAYFRDNPAVLSDVVLALRTGALPGDDFRPLDQDDGGVWVLHPNYPLDRLPDLATARRNERQSISDNR